MAILFPKKLLFLHHPRTGGTATSDALRRIGGHHVGNGQHSYYDTDVLKACTIRNPYDVLASWFVMNVKYSTMTSFLQNYSHNEFTREGRLFYFARRCDVHLPYPSLATRLNLLLGSLGLPKAKIRRINTTSGKLPFMSYYTPSAIDIVEQLFVDDLNIYRSLP